MVRPHGLDPLDWPSFAAMVVIEAEVARRARRHLRSTILASRRPFRRGVSGALSFALLGVSIALPVLDAWERSEVASIEAAHDVGSCSSQHDHAACSQLASSHAVPGGPTPGACVGQQTHTAGIISRQAPHACVRHTSSLPRAPPSNA